MTDETKLTGFACGPDGCKPLDESNLSPDTRAAIDELFRDDDTRARLEKIREQRIGDETHGLEGDVSWMLGIIEAQRAEIERLEKVADWLAQASANSGWGGVRLDADSWREAAAKAVAGEKHDIPTPGDQ